MHGSRSRFVSLVMALVVTGLFTGMRPLHALTPVAQPAISVPDMIVGEGDGFVDVPVTLSAPGQSAVSVRAITGNDSAGYGSDYVAVNNTLNFAAGETSKIVHIPLVDDGTPEGLESFFLYLDTVSSTATIAKSAGRITIIDNDTVVNTPHLFVRDTVVDEKDGTASVPVLMGGPKSEASNSTVTVNYATSDAGATAGSDYIATSGTLTFTPSETVKNIVVPITDDNKIEPFERFTVTLSSPTNATIADGTGVVVIGASDATQVAQPSLSVPDVIVGEADGYVDMVVSLSAPGQTAVSVRAITGNETAGYGSDYRAFNTYVNFAPGETTKVVRLELMNDVTPEGFESFFLYLDNQSANATIAKSVGRISIVDNDTVVAAPHLFVRDAVVDERDGTASIPVLLGGVKGESSNTAITVNYSTGNAGATAGSDYTAASGTLKFAPGDTVKNVIVDITDDTATEPFERFTVTLSNPHHATIQDGTGVVVIGASDATQVAQPAISVPDVIVGEGDGYVDMVVSLSAPGQSPISVTGHHGERHGRLRHRLFGVQLARELRSRRDHKGRPPRARQRRHARGLRVLFPPSRQPVGHRDRRQERRAGRDHR